MEILKPPPPSLSLIPATIPLTLISSPFSLFSSSFHFPHTHRPPFSSLSLFLFSLHTIIPTTAALLTTDDSTVGRQSFPKPAFPPPAISYLSLFHTIPTAPMSSPHCEHRHHHPLWSSPQVAIFASTPVALTPSLHYDTHSFHYHFKSGRSFFLSSVKSSQYIVWRLGFVHCALDTVYWLCWFGLVYLLEIKSCMITLFSMACDLFVVLSWLDIFRVRKKIKHNELIG